MKFSRTTAALGALLAGLVCAGAADAVPRKAAGPDTMPATPRFAVLPGRNLEAIKASPNAGLTTWDFTYTYKHKNYSETFVGNAPTGAASTTPVILIPIKIVVKGETFTTSTAQANGLSALVNTTNSPIFKSNVDFVEGSQDLGMTQYEDAYQRESFWPSVAGNPGYHVLLGTPKVQPEVTLNVPAADGTTGSEFGVHVALVDINWLDGQIATLIAANKKIKPNTVPIFIMYNTYQTQGGCCIGGYHSANGGQTYNVFDYIGTPGAFAQDVSALSHEMGEWLDDPYTTNTSPCGIYENGDPLEREANYGGYPYTVGTMTYNLQDLAQPPYFGAPASTTLDGRATFQGTSLTVCKNGA